MFRAKKKVLFFGTSIKKTTKQKKLYIFGILPQFIGDKYMIAGGSIDSLNKKLERSSGRALALTLLTKSIGLPETILMCMRVHSAERSLISLCLEPSLHKQLDLVTSSDQCMTLRLL